jgi:hypothetical protein
MNARAARLKRFDAFSASVLRCTTELIRLERACGAPRSEFMASLSAVYDRLHVMELSARLISNAKLLHFLFPHHLMPVDGQHTLNFLYGHVAYQPASWYLEVITFQQDVLGRVADWPMYLDERWNATAPKLVHIGLNISMAMPQAVCLGRST